MKKPKLLRKALEAAIPEIRNEPDRLALWVEDGTVECTHTATGGFAMAYPLSVLLTQLETDIAVVVLAITRWLRVNQPDLLQPNKASFTFETDVLDATTADLLFTIRLRENVKVTPNDDGSSVIDYLDEPDPLFDDGISLINPDPAPNLVEVQTIDDILLDG